MSDLDTFNCSIDRYTGVYHVIVVWLSSDVVADVKSVHKDDFSDIGKSWLLHL